MYQSIHRVKKIVKGEIEKLRNDKDDETYTMKITIIYEDFGTCKERYSFKKMNGWMEIETQLTLFAESEEALELKASVLTTEVA